jgi:hypothetical protein
MRAAWPQPRGAIVSRSPQEFDTMHSAARLPRPRRLRTLATAALLLAAAWLPQLEAAAAYSRLQEAEVDGPSPILGTSQHGAWWLALQEPALNTLIETAARHALIGQPHPDSEEALLAAAAPSLQAQVAALYVGARVTSVRLMLARSLAESVAQQKQLLAAASPRQAAADALKQLEQRAAQAHGLQQQLAQQQALLIGTLARLCAVPAAELAQVLAPALAVRSAPMLAGAAETSAAALAADTAQPVVLRASARAAATLAETVSARQLELEAVRKRVALGEASRHELLESFQRLLADGDRLVTAQGVLAMEWIGHQARLPAGTAPAEPAGSN